MGFWSTLGTIGGIVAAPFTGGATAALLPTLGGALGGIGDKIANNGSTLGDAGTVLGKDAASAAQGRIAQANVQNAQDRNALDFYNSELKAPSTAASQAVRGALMQRLQDASITGLPSRINVPQISGGLKPSALGPDKNAIGSQLFSTAMGNAKNMKPLTPPSVTPLPTPSTFDKVAAGGGTGLSLLGALSPLFRHAPGGSSGGVGPLAGGYGFPGDLTGDPGLLGDEDTSGLFDFGG